MDCDEQGRAAAAAIENDLLSVCEVRVLDLAPHRNDGYDLTDWLLDGRSAGAGLAFSDFHAAIGVRRYDCR
jgi:hypothetical protein